MTRVLKQGGSNERVIIEADDPGAAATARGPAEEGASTLTIMALPPERIPLADIRREPELQCRAKGINRGTVAEYAEAMKAGATFPAVTIFRDGKGVCWLADGWHRCAAAERAGLLDVAVEVREGSRKDALLYAASANGSHGLRRTNADKRAAVQRLLKAFPKMKDREIGRACNVDHKTVGKLRRPAEAGGEIPSTGAGAGGEIPSTGDYDLDEVYFRLITTHNRPVSEHRESFKNALAAARRLALEAEGKMPRSMLGDWAREQVAAAAHVVAETSTEGV